jgi:hypothetical protein
METENRAFPTQQDQSQSETTRLNISDDRTAMWGVVAEYQKQRTNGARWFFWVAALSLINSVVILANGNWGFLAGLGITQIISGFALGMSEDLGVGVTVVAFALNLIVLLICVGFGIFAQKGHTWAFVVGMVLYAADGLIFLWVQDWLSLGFHAFVLYGMYRGLAANRRLAELKAEGLTVE